MINFSKNKKLNNVLNIIHDEMIENVGLGDIKRYHDEFKYVSDYNIYQYGNLRIYYDDIRELYKDYKSLIKVNDNEIEKIYKRQVGFVARYILNNEYN